jgi:hypothetical protein
VELVEAGTSPPSDPAEPPDDDPEPPLDELDEPLPDELLDEPPLDEPPLDELLDEPPLDEPPLDEPLAGSPLDEPPLDDPPLDEPPLDEPPLEELPDASAAVPASWAGGAPASTGQVMDTCTHPATALHASAVHGSPSSHDSHATHALPCGSGWYVPAGHAMHASEPVGAYVPGAHTSQRENPSCVERMPDGQAMHSVAPT